MRTLRVDLGERGYDITIGRGILSHAGDYVSSRGGKVMLITDTNVAPLYARTVIRSLTDKGYNVKSLALPAGEKTKSFGSLPAIYSVMLDFGLTRSDTVVTLGGGVIGDLGGFAAATYMRGVDFVQIPTSLLAQVDSSVGGKVGVDLPQGKNLVGAFHQPEAVIIDPDTLSTLPDEFFSDGMGEIIKYGCIKSKELFGILMRTGGDRKAFEASAEDIIYRCVDIKRAVVEADEKESGERKLLNFGHTYGHALEKLCNYEGIAHGHAVAIGMVYVTRLSESRGQTAAGCASAIEELCRKYDLPVTFDADTDEIIKAVASDKKSRKNGLDIVLLRDIGEAYVYPATAEYFRG